VDYTTEKKTKAEVKCNLEKSKSLASYGEETMNALLEKLNICNRIERS
jgi:hypothetical protein